MCDLPIGHNCESPTPTSWIKLVESFLLLWRSPFFLTHTSWLLSQPQCGSLIVIHLLHELNLSQLSTRITFISLSVNTTSLFELRSFRDLICCEGNTSHDWEITLVAESKFFQSRNDVEGSPLPFTTAFSTFPESEGKELYEKSN